MLWKFFVNLFGSLSILSFSSLLIKKKKKKEKDRHLAVFCLLISANIIYMFIYLHKLLCKKKAERKQNFCKINEKKVFDIFIYKTFFFLIKIHFNFPEFFFFTLQVIIHFHNLNVRHAARHYRHQQNKTLAI